MKLHHKQKNSSADFFKFWITADKHLQIPFGPAYEGMVRRKDYSCLRFLITASLTRVSRPLMSLSIFLFPVFGSTPSCPALYLPCPCSDREIHTWRTLSVGYCMFTSSHQRIHSFPHWNYHLALCCGFQPFQVQMHLMTKPTPGKWMWYIQY